MLLCLHDERSLLRLKKPAWCFSVTWEWSKSVCRTLRHRQQWVTSDESGEQTTRVSAPSTSAVCLRGTDEMRPRPRRLSPHGSAAGRSSDRCMLCQCNVHQAHYTKQKNACFLLRQWVSGFWIKSSIHLVHKQTELLYAHRSLHVKFYMLNISMLAANCMLVCSG